MTSTTVAITTGTLTAKIQRHEAASTSLPPTSGPITVAIADHAVHEPTAAPRLSAGNASTITASAAGTTSAPNTPCRMRAATSTPIDGASAHASDMHAEADQPEREDAALAVDVAERSADEDQRREREHVAVGDPLLAGEPAAEIGGDRRQRDVDRRRVEHGDERPHDRGQQCQPLRPRHCNSGDGGIRVLPVTSGISIATSSSKHQDHSSPGSSERMIGWPLSFACAVA